MVMMLAILASCSNPVAFAPVDDIADADFRAAAAAVDAAGCSGYLVRDLYAFTLIDYDADMQLGPALGMHTFRQIRYGDQAVLLHEIAHTLGYPDSLDNELMWPASLGPTPLDVQAAQFVELTHCRRCMPPEKCL